MPPKTRQGIRRDRIFLSNRALGATAIAVPTDSQIGKSSQPLPTYSKPPGPKRLDGAELGRALEVHGPIAGDHLIEQAQVVCHRSRQALLGTGGQDQSPTFGALVSQKSQYLLVQGKEPYVELGQLRESPLELGLALDDPGPDPPEPRWILAEDGQESLVEEIGREQAAVQIDAEDLSGRLRLIGAHSALGRAFSWSPGSVSRSRDLHTVVSVPRASPVLGRAIRDGIGTGRGESIVRVICWSVRDGRLVSKLRR